MRPINADAPTIDTKLEVLSREDFKARMTDIKTISDREDQIMDILYKNGISIDNSLVNEAIAVSIKCLNSAMRLNNTTPIGSEIEYYIYELDWGKKGKDAITYGERKISLTNLDELYDYLLEYSLTSL